jgi:hypothetical protein
MRSEHPLLPIYRKFSSPNAIYHLSERPLFRLAEASPTHAHPRSIAKFRVMGYEFLKYYPAPSSNNEDVHPLLFRELWE